MKITIVVPTYNESQNVEKLILTIKGIFLDISNYEMNLLFVDGNSTDNTSQIVKSYSQNDNRIHLLQEKEKSGLGSAYIKGFKHALSHLKPEVIVEMDADFQHDPKDVLRFIQEIENGADYVIGSRFVKGGSIPQNWAFYRKLLSKGGNIFTRVVLKIPNIYDFTSGFKASRVRGFVDKINFDEVLSGGFAYKIDLLYRMHKLGAKIKEIPIVFGLRDRGDSKMEKSNFLDSLRVVILIRYRESKSFFKFLIVGFAGLFVDGTTFNIFRFILPSSSIAAAVSGLFGMTTTFLLNNFWSFKERKIEGSVKKATSFGVYVFTSIIPIIVRTQLVGWITRRFGDTFILSNLAFFLGILFGLVWNYTIYSRIIWRSKSAQKLPQLR